MTSRLSLTVSLLSLLGAPLGAGCNSRSASLLCTACADDSQCGGNPCFEDTSGNRFCGAPCSQCPDGTSCQSVTGTNGKSVNSCYPDSESCAQVVPPGGGDGGALPDGAAVVPDAGSIIGGPIGPTGGTVDHLLFGFTGDTRPEFCGMAYPQMIIDNIFAGMKQKGVQFAVDQGDHMFNCGFSNAAYAGAKTQMAYYASAASSLGKTVFMTMGNHECSGSTLCSLASYGGNPNYTAFMDVLAPISKKPYYRFDVTTKTGLAVFIVIADNAWDTVQKDWLTEQLTDSDQKAKYTFVSKHHPDGNSDNAAFPEIYSLVKQHKYTLFLTGHSHLYKRQPSDPRAVVVGCGGAPLAGSSFWGYGTAEQRADDRIYVNIYDQATGNMVDSFNVGPQ